MADVMDTTGADGETMSTVTEAVADLLLSNTTTLKEEVVPEDCCAAFNINAESDQAAGFAGKAQVELNVGADWEQDQAYDRPKFLVPAV